LPAGSWARLIAGQPERVLPRVVHKQCTHVTPPPPACRRHRPRLLPLWFGYPFGNLSYWVGFVFTLGCIAWVINGHYVLYVVGAAAAGSKEGAEFTAAVAALFGGKCGAYSFEGAGGLGAAICWCHPRRSGVGVGDYLTLADLSQRVCWVTTLGCVAWVINGLTMHCTVWGQLRQEARKGLTLWWQSRICLEVGAVRCGAYRGGRGRGLSAVCWCLGCGWVTIPP
jgi:hypothetical protein